MEQTQTFGPSTEHGGPKWSFVRRLCSPLEVKKVDNRVGVGIKALPETHRRQQKKKRPRPTVTAWGILTTLKAVSRSS
ncbi:hypothetical protein E1B28_002858 [Marasmius oreades]|uniref:Uncharacterized protein n=1 Tax=Marasmius oreades TaxID=181124 RepID=A0A9P7UNH7_9AGAR|nr:uncharacterized protein E1B28_002858 [Marasmius oreades]KAG7086941.1 hypothetical protein E1B28_002858 [Marasmius oreades]